MPEKKDPRTGPVEVVPTRSGWTSSQIAGVVTGAGTLLLALTLLGIYLTVVAS